MEGILINCKELLVVACWKINDDSEKNIDCLILESHIFEVLFSLEKQR